MKILLAGPVPPHPGGGAISRGQLASGFARAGHEVCIVAPITSDAMCDGDRWAAAHPELGVEKWRTQLSRRDRVLFTSVAGDLLEELGYEAPNPARWVSPPERLAWRGHHAVVSLGRRVRMAIDPEFVKTSWQFVRARLLGARGRS